MAEYISKEEMLKNLNADFEHNAGECEPLTIKIMQRFIEYVENFPTVDVQPVEWISCKDKMPEDNMTVLFCYVSENGVKSVHYGYHQTIRGMGSSWAKTSGGWQYCDEDVTHWMPLPEPPKDGDTE